MSGILRDVERLARELEGAMHSLAAAIAGGMSALAELAPELERIAREQGRIQIVTMDDGVTRRVAR